MKITRVIASSAVICSLALPSTAEEEKESGGGLSAEVSVDFMSHYVWRGQICSDDPVWQPSVTIGYDFEDFGSISANLWMSLYATHNGTPHRACGTHEIDYTLSYANSIGPVNMEVGHLWYTFPNQPDDDSTEELYVTFAYENEFITPSYSVYWDYCDTAGNDPGAVYMQFAFAHEFNPFENFTITPSIGVGLGDAPYMKSYVDVNRTEFADMTTSIAAAYAITDYLSVGGTVNYTWIMSHDLREADYMGDGRNQIVYGGINITLSF